MLKAYVVSARFQKTRLMKKLTVRPDRTLEDCTTGRALSFLFKAALDKLRTAVNWVDGWRLATHSGRGLLYARHDGMGENVELFQMEAAEAVRKYVNTHVPGGFAEVGFKGTDAEAVAAAARRYLEQNVAT